MGWRVSILLHSNVRAGSSLILFRGANALVAAGHRVEIVFEERLFPKAVDFFPLAPGIATRFADEPAPWALADVTIFSWWQTAFSWRRAPGRAVVLYLMGDAKPLYGTPALDLYVDLVYRDSGLRFMHLNSDMAREELAEVAQHSALVPGGVELARFTGAVPLLPPAPPGVLRVLLEGPPDAAHKRIGESIAALADLPGIELVHCAANDARPSDPRVRAMGSVPFANLPGLFASCDLIAKLSVHETFALPVLESFAAGGTAISTAFQGHADYIRHEENALVVPLDDPWAAARQAFIRLRDDPALLARLRRAARLTAEAFDWPRFEGCFVTAVERHAASAGATPPDTPLFDRYAAAMRAAVHLWALSRAG